MDPPVPRTEERPTSAAGAQRSCARRRGCTNPPGQPCLVCPYAYACPRCHQRAGAGCRRPSGHDCEIHLERVLIADAVAVREYPDRVRAVLGDRGLTEWQARTTGAITPATRPEPDRAPSRQLTLGLGGTEA
jgi:hypothetical protein